MKNQKIPTWLGTVIIIIIAVTIGMFAWKIEESNKKIESQAPSIASQQNQDQEHEEVEFPTVKAQPGMTLEDIIKQALYEKTPDWKIRNYDIDVTVETNKNSHAIGRFVYDGYNVTKDGKYHNVAEGIWFAAKSDEGWTLVETSGAGYWGSCQVFKRYDFPIDMTPDCWDTEKNILINTSNPERFYPDNFAKADKNELVQAFISYIKKEVSPKNQKSNNYLTKDLYVKIDKKIDNYISGAILIGGLENISVPYFLAVKKNGKWIVVYNGQDIPSCNIVEPYKFPNKIIGSCYDEINKKEKKVL